MFKTAIVPPATTIRSVHERVRRDYKPARLGGGAFGVAYERGKTEVVKVAHCGNKGLNDGWLVWAGSAMAAPNIYQPSIKEVTLLQWEGKDKPFGYVAIMERLTPNVTETLNRDDAAREVEKLSLEHWGVEHPQYLMRSSKRSNVPKTVKFPDDCAKLFESFRIAFDVMDRNPDLHNGNWMMRGKIPVITDPCT